MTKECLRGVKAKARSKLPPTITPKPTSKILSLKPESPTRKPSSNTKSDLRSFKMPRTSNDNLRVAPSKPREETVKKSSRSSNHSRQDESESKGSSSHRKRRKKKVKKLEEKKPKKNSKKEKEPKHKKKKPVFSSPSSSSPEPESEEP